MSPGRAEPSKSLQAPPFAAPPGPARGMSGFWTRQVDLDEKLFPVASAVEVIVSIFMSLDELNRNGQPLVQSVVPLLDVGPLLRLDVLVGLLFLLLPLLLQWSGKISSALGVRSRGRWRRVIIIRFSPRVGCHVAVVGVVDGL